MPLESSWNVYVLNELVHPIKVLKTQVMVEKRARSQNFNLIPDH